MKPYKVSWPHIQRTEQPSTRMMRKPTRGRTASMHRSIDRRICFWDGIDKWHGILLVHAETGASREARAARGDGSFSHNSYQWDWVSTEGDFSKGGAGGQGLYVSPSRDLVIAWFGTPDEDGRGNSMSAIARQLASSDLFVQ